MNKIFWMVLSGWMTLSSVAWASEPKTIYWLFFELPGAVNFQSDKNRAGYIMDIYFVLKSKMPEYTHQVIDVPFLRIIQQMKKKKGVCSLMILKSKERESYMHFGSPYVKGFPAGVIVKKNNPKLRKYLKSPKVVDLEILLKDKNLQFGTIPERFYGKKITQILGQYKTGQMIEKKGTNADHELRNMLQLDRIDAYFGYPFEALGNERLEFYFVKDNVDILDPRVSCENSEFGKTVVQKTEDLRKKYKLDQQFESIYEHYYPKSLQEEFRHINQ